MTPQEDTTPGVRGHRVLILPALTSGSIPRSSGDERRGGLPVEVGASLVTQMAKNPPVMGADPGSIPGLGRSPGEGKGYPLQYSGLENPVACTVQSIGL